MKRSLILTLLFLVAAPVAWSQDLDRLLERAKASWTDRMNRNTAKVLTYIDPQTRNNFSPLSYENITEASVAGFEFSQDATKVIVSVKTKVTVPNLGGVYQSMGETWVWTNGNWFLQLEAAAPAFSSALFNSSAAVTANTAPPFKFQLIDRTLDLGRHVQGDIISGSVKFSAPKNQLTGIRGRGLPGLRVASLPHWIDEKSGTVDFTLDTSLIWKDLRETLIFEGIGPSNGFAYVESADRLTLTASIEGKVRVTQLPQTDSQRRDRYVELEFENLGRTPLSIESMQTLSTTFQVDGTDVPPALQPGETGIVPVWYVNYPRLMDEELLIKFSPGILPKNSLFFRLAAGESQAPVRGNPSSPTRQQQ